MNKFLTVHLLWLVVLFAPAQQVVAQKQKTTQDTLFVLPADTIMPGQKKPFTDAQRLEANNKRYLLRAVVPSAALIGAGILTIQERGFISSFDTRDARNRHFPEFSTRADDFIMIAPLVGLYGFNLISSQNRHELGRQTLLLGLSGALASAIVWPVKGITDIDRPNGEPFAFPSGHTTYAFTIATFMDKEFRHKSPWVSVASYGVAGATGVLRVLNNKHWMADILAGAGVGIISVNTVYWVHAKLTQGGGLKRTSFVPAVFPGGARGMAVTVAF